LSIAFDEMQQAFIREGRTNRHDLAMLLWSINFLHRWLTTDGKQPTRLDSWDKNLIEQCRAKGFSYDDVSFILSRSKSTIFEYAKTVFPETVAP
jgi:hypothetical protein